MLLNVAYELIKNASHDNGLRMHLNALQIRDAHRMCSGRNKQHAFREETTVVSLSSILARQVVDHHPLGLGYAAHASHALDRPPSAVQL